MTSARRAAREEAFLRPAGEEGPRILAAIAQQTSYPPDEVAGAAQELPEKDPGNRLRWAIANR